MISELTDRLSDWILGTPKYRGVTILENAAGHASAVALAESTIDPQEAASWFEAALMLGQMAETLDNELVEEMCQ